MKLEWVKPELKVVSHDERDRFVGLLCEALMGDPATRNMIDRVFMKGRFLEVNGLNH